MQVDTDGLREEVIPWLTKAFERVKNAEKICRKIDVPYGFYYEDFLSRHKEMSDLKEKIEGHRVWVEGKISNFSTAEVNIKQTIGNGLNSISLVIGDAVQKITNSVKDISFSATEKILKILAEKGIYPENMTVDEFFKYFEVISGEYGANQGILSAYYYFDENGELIKLEGYSRLEKMVMEKYNMSAKDANILITAINSAETGACSYGAAAGNILLAFKDRPEEFEKHFGFPMYRQTKDGKIVFNQEELLIDLYVGINNHTDYLEKDGYEYIDSNVDLILGAMEVDPDTILSKDSGRTVFKSQQRVNDITLTDYLNSKGLVCNYSEKNFIFIYGGMMEREMNANGEVTFKDVDGEYTKMKVEKDLKAGKQVEMIINVSPTATPSNIWVYNYNGRTGWYCRPLKTGHGVAVTDVDDDGIYYATWGCLGFSYFKDLLNEGTEVWIRTYEISEKQK